MHLMTEKSIKVFLTMIYARYIDRNGYSFHKLTEYPFPITYEPDNELFIERSGSTKKYLCTQYFKELEARGLMEKSESSFYLTAKGFTEGYKLKHPLKYFCKVHWKWGVATAIAVLGFISTVIYRYGVTCISGS
ncbi:hypothetical protein [Alcanivorax sp.]|uniref:hypothetical protein n=1 Tax=Alcanivorax sp. TaxID=1872427 RepID=UPI000C0C786C|nr:hypothetical protein [Alcanivorax sp.]PHR64511.1 MAG: hypothetical protein COA55_13695 [Alcanivorax sp.]